MEFGLTFLFSVHQLVPKTLLESLKLYILCMKLFPSVKNLWYQSSIMKQLPMYELGISMIFKILKDKT